MILTTCRGRLPAPRRAIRLLHLTAPVLLAALVLSGCRARDRDRMAADGGAPEANRFTRAVIAEGLDEPMHMDFDSAGRVYVAERTGGVRRIDPNTGIATLLGTVPVFTDGEGGLLGILLDRAFDANRRLFLYYMAAGDQRVARLSRFTLRPDGALDPASEIVVLSWPHDVASHMGGGMAWEPGTGNLILTVGENSVPTQYTPIHWTEAGGRREDSQRTAANTNDLRGKILRIHPEEDGSYTIPQGNLFPPGTARTRPEIYTMGNRNPWRVSVDSETGAIHWGEIGPDAGQDSTGIGPRGYDELNVATGPGNFGWPYFIGDNLAYNRWDDSTRSYGPPFDPARPVNASPNNTGLRELPPAIPAVLAYPYAVSEEYPELNSGGRAAVGGPVFRSADFEGAERAFPDYYDGRWFVVDFVRNWIMVMTLNDDRTDVEAMERFLPAERYNSPIDMKFGPQGDLYVLEYGRAPTGRLSRISYNAGNRPPVVTVAADRTAGALPLRVALSSEGTTDPDGDDLEYEWIVTPAAGGQPQRFDTTDPVLTLDRPGAYTARLTVRDAAGAADTASLSILAGNEPPEVALDLTRGNRTFFFLGDTIRYATTVTDREDGSLGAGGIPADAVTVTLEYLPAGLSREEAAELGKVPPTTPMRHVRALSIMAGSDCAGCHAVDAPSVGPSFRQVAARYTGRAEAAAYLAEKIVAGGTGVWGDIPMPSHPGMSAVEATTLADYVLALGRDDDGPRLLPPSGTAVLTPSEPARPGGAYLLRAAYTDRGATGAAPIRGADVLLLRHPRFAPET
ncbi:MAG TPA: PQQ-dependent sugar dehydrogenase, partial [Longimicrobiaceae bacterium]